jgi:CRISPR/Cas system-associated endonuclease Cas1
MFGTTKAPNVSITPAKIAMMAKGFIILVIFSGINNYLITFYEQQGKLILNSI